MMAPTGAWSTGTIMYVPLEFTIAAPFDRSADWNRSTAADFVTGFGV